MTTKLIVPVLDDLTPEFAKSDVLPTLYSYRELKAVTRDFNPRDEGGRRSCLQGTSQDVFSL